MKNWKQLMMIVSLSTKKQIMLTYKKYIFEILQVHQYQNPN